MPVYLYEHVSDEDRFNCPKEIEIEQNIKDDALTVCLDCGGKIKRLIAGSTFVQWKGGAPTPKSFS